MGLDCIPRPNPTARQKGGSKAPEGRTHLRDAPCPFADDNLPLGLFTTCCSLRGEVAARELEALGEADVAKGMFDDMTPHLAIAFALRLRCAADSLERRYEGSTAKPQGAGWNGTWNTEREDWNWKTHSTFEEALARIREAARWYEKVGSLGYGVHAWY